MSKKRANPALPGTELLRAGSDFRHWSIHVGATTASRRQRVLGGASRDRTGDLKLAKLALSQLSYGPVV